jgi:hypothetical protein
MNVIFQRVIWLATGFTTHRSQVIQPQQNWKPIPKGHSVGMLLLQLYHLSAGSDLIIEGSNNLDAWTEIRRISGATWSADDKFVGVGLSASYPLSDGNDHLHPSHVMVAARRFSLSQLCFSSQEACEGFSGMRAAGGPVKRMKRWRMWLIRLLSPLYHQWASKQPRRRR